MTPSELRAAMDRLGMSTAQLAIALRLGKGGDSTVRKWLRGDRQIQGPTQVTIELLLEDEQYQWGRCPWGQGR